MTGASIKSKRCYKETAQSITNSPAPLLQLSSTRPTATELDLIGQRSYTRADGVGLHMRIV